MSLRDIALVRISADNVLKTDSGVPLTEDIVSLISKYKQSMHPLEDVYDDFYDINDEYDVYELIIVEEASFDDDASDINGETLAKFVDLLDDIERANDNGPHLEDEELVGLMLERVATIYDMESVLRDASFVPAGNEEELGAYYFDDLTAQHGIPEEIRGYFDVSAYGKDLANDGVFVNGSVFVTGY